MARRLMTLVALIILLAPLIASGAEPPPRQTSPPTILSIIPAQGEPGITVTLYGTGFTGKTAVFLGSVEMKARVSGPQQLTFEIPRLDPGLYALYLKREDGATSKLYNFTLVPVKPVAVSIAPDTVYACATGHDRVATISGHNFQAGSQVVFDGAAIRTRFVSAESLSFSVPRVAGGLHQVQVKNPGDTSSGVIGLVIDDRPEITGITRGDEYVNYYDLIIEGKNFQQNSSLVVTEEQSLEETPSRPEFDVKRITSSSGSTTEREKLLFINCNRIIYQRHPYSTTPKNFSIQIVNPSGGGESAVVSVNAP